MKDWAFGGGGSSSSWKQGNAGMKWQNGSIHDSLPDVLPGCQLDLWRLADMQTCRYANTAGMHADQTDMHTFFFFFLFTTTKDHDVKAEIG